MGRNSSTLWARVDLGTRITLAAFHSVGKYDDSRLKLNSLQRLWLIAGAVVLSNLALGASTPVALVGSSLDNTHRTSSAEMGLKWKELGCSRMVGGRCGVKGPVAAAEKC